MSLDNIDLEKEISDIKNYKDKRYTYKIFSFKVNMVSFFEGLIVMFILLYMIDIFKSKPNEYIFPLIFLLFTYIQILNQINESKINKTLELLIKLQEKNRVE
jgi:hypothetical protein